MDQRTKGLIENVMDLRHGEHLVFTFDEATPATLMPHQVREVQHIRPSRALSMFDGRCLGVSRC